MTSAVGLIFVAIVFCIFADKELIVLVGTISLMAGVMWYLAVKEDNAARAKDKEGQLNDVCGPTIRAHLSELAIKRRQLTLKGDYGLIDDSRWQKEKRKFYDMVVVPALLAAGSRKGRQVGVLVDFERVDMDIELAIDARESQEVSAGAIAHAAYDETLDGVGYELYCSSVLTAYGWETRQTPASGDQGADIVAIWEGARVVVQCKHYGPGRTVGNKAVQEVSAAKLHYQADLAVVITNVAFTASAKQLAASADVHLLHHDQLPSLMGLLQKSLDASLV
ncbi:restriction endonuclease [Cupriavidus necator]